jgi:DNA polymerase
LGRDEQYRWQLTQIQNDRGVGIDRELLTKTGAMGAARLSAIQDELKQVTNNALYSIHQVPAMRDWLAKEGCTLADLQAPTVERALKRDDLSPTAHSVLSLRAEAAHNLKVEGLQACCDIDNRVRDTCIYSGAGTGRQASRSPNLQNLQREEGDTLAKVKAVLSGDLAKVAAFGPVLQVLGTIDRALPCAAPGKRLFMGDWSGQESRGLAWIAGEQWKCDGWATFDRTGKLEDEPYYQLGIKCGRPPEIARAFGKALDLAGGYGSGGERVRTQMLKSLDLPADANFEHFVQIWRAAHPRTCAFWTASAHRCCRLAPSR